MPTELHFLPLHDALPISLHTDRLRLDRDAALALEVHRVEHLRAHLPLRHGVGQLEDAVRERRLAVVDVRDDREVDRKSTRLNSSHVERSYAVFCLKKKKK